ncbi:MAG: hypothetical protein KIC88_00695 [Acinetobacter sp.]|nr:hypothetical protein [Acinetobacter sp.]DAB11905.1 MAG TPA: hypothetical protein CPT91_05030 [Candidatus Gastranaerophilales bacterium HUM_16]
MLGLMHSEEMFDKEIDAMKAFFYSLGRDNFWKIYKLLYNSEEKITQETITDAISNTAVYNDLQFMKFIGLIKVEKVYCNDRRYSQPSYYYYLNEDNKNLNFSEFIEEKQASIIKNKIEIEGETMYDVLIDVFSSKARNSNTLKRYQKYKEILKTD